MRASAKSKGIIHLLGWSRGKHTKKDTAATGIKRVSRSEIEYAEVIEEEETRSDRLFKAQVNNLR
jgi:hypothetical protein